MATKSKNTNFFIKFAAIVLSVILMTCAFSSAVRIIRWASCYGFNIADIFESEKQVDLSDNIQIRYDLMDDINQIENSLYAKNTNGVVNKFKSKKTDFIHYAMSVFKEEKSNYNADPEWYEDSYGTIVNINYFFNFRGLDYSFNIDENSKSVIYVTDSEKIAMKKLEANFEEFIHAKNPNTYLTNDYSEIYVRDLRYYVVDKKNNIKVSNFPKDTDYKNVLSNKYAFTIIDGKISYSPEFQGILDFSIEDDGKNALVDDNCDYYFYLDETANVSNSYIDEIEISDAVGRYNLKAEAIKCILFFLLSLILAVYSFVVCGRKMDNAKVKRAFIDYLPSDLHLVLTGFAIAGLVILIVIQMDTIFCEGLEYEKLLLLGLNVCAAAIWALFIELITSIVRVCKSEKSIFKNSVIFLLLKYILFVPTRTVIRAIKKLHTYQPQNFKKLLIRGLIGYGVINFLFIVFIVFAIIGDAFEFLLIPMLIDIAFNIACVVFAVRYAVNLDKIITAAHNRTIPQVHYNKLPNSLKTLVNSLQYTRQELNAAVNKAVRDERMRTELITNVSHDLKTPLTSIINYVDLLKGCDIRDENAKEYISVLDEKGNKLKRLIDDLIEASKVTSGVINLNPIDLNLNELATQAVVEHQREFLENNLQLVFKGDKGNVNAFADGNKTYRIIENLLSNALKYSLKGTRVYADVYETQNYSIFEIKNTSAQELNISPTELTERFVRGDKSRTNEGNGLGLSIAENLCRAQNGHLNITIDGDLFKVKVLLPKKK